MEPQFFFFDNVNKYIDQKNGPPYIPKRQTEGTWPKQEIQQMKEQDLNPKQGQQRQIPPLGPDMRI